MMIDFDVSVSEYTSLYVLSFVSIFMQLLIFCSDDAIENAHPSPKCQSHVIIYIENEGDFYIWK